MATAENRKVSDFFNALSHPIRVDIVIELLKGTKCVSDMKSLLDMNQPSVSQHLSVLKANGIVDWHQDGKRKCYFLRNPVLIRNILKMVKK